MQFRTACAIRNQNPQSPSQVSPCTAAAPPLVPPSPPAQLSSSQPRRATATSAAMSKKGGAKKKAAGGGELSRFLETHLQTINDTFQMMSESAPGGGLERTEWSEVVKLGDQVSRQATVAGMLWSGDLPDVATLKENIDAYFNILQGFLLVCHGSLVGVGPTLHKSISSSAKNVIDSSFSLFKQAVSAYESRSPDRKIIIPQVTGTVWEACVALKKVPTTNCIAIGRAMTQVGVYLKDILREMNELPIGDSSDSTAGKSSNGIADTASCSDRDEMSFDLDLDDDFSEEEIAVTKLVISVASDSLVVVKETIRFITGLLKSAGNQSGANEEKVDTMEKLLIYCKKIADQVNDLGAAVYPPQDASDMKLTVTRLYDGIKGMREEIGHLGGSPAGAFAALDELVKCLGSLESELADDVVDEMENLTISH
ncbi:hypothetical protein PR202_gb02054 [Eleusine coracana subsp. coracana]|uniref:Uncharacterized protein n=1 Tax=Eleusine coracana subsp. coracana TaxID=191504 RepID=A0AAV5DY14_ELECO|nr:hypothetical protein PR202_gb02054 [Eleusine coracana subsp. coracana]